MSQHHVQSKFKCRPVSAVGGACNNWKRLFGIRFGESMKAKNEPRSRSESESFSWTIAAQFAWFLLSKQFFSLRWVRGLSHNVVRLRCQTCETIKTFLWQQRHGFPIDNLFSHLHIRATVNSTRSSRNWFHVSSELGIRGALSVIMDFLRSRATTQTLTQQPDRPRSSTDYYRGCWKSVFTIADLLRFMRR